MKASVIFFPNELKINRETGRVPVYMRVCFQRLKSDSRLNIEISSKDLLKWDPITMRMAERNSPVNHLLNRIEQKFTDFLISNATSLSQHTASTIKEYVLGISPKQQQNVMQFIDNYFENAVAKNSNVRPGTVKQYRRAINHLIRFLEIRHQKSMTFDQLDYEFASTFKQYLVGTDLKINKAGMTEVSAATVIKKFRTIFSHALDQELIKKNPFKTVKIKTKSPRKERLTIHQVKQLWNLDLSEMPYQQVYRDIFMFSVFTGLAYQDAMSLRWSNLEKRNCGNTKLTINRTKSEIITEIFLTSHAANIAEKYKKDIGIILGQNVLPCRSNKEVNQQLKIIGNMVGIAFKLSTHTARHTFRQLLAEAGISDYGVIKRMMGQSRRGDVDEVYYSVTENALIIAKEKFNDYLLMNLS